MFCLLQSIRSKRQQTVIFHSFFLELASCCGLDVSLHHTHIIEKHLIVGILLYSIPFYSVELCRYLYA